MAAFSLVMKCALMMMVVYHLGDVDAMPAVDDYEAVEVGVDAEIPVEDKLEPKDICNMPMKRGNCRALLLRWRYDPTTGECQEFKYGGCAGNANNFSTKKQCLRMCDGI